MPERSGQSTLVLEDAFGCADPVSCLDSALGDTPADVLCVVYRGSVSERLDALRARNESVASAAVVCVGPAADRAGDRESAAIRAVPDPADLTGVGMAATEWVRGRTDDRPAAVCLDSLSTLLQYAETERVFRFLHALLGQFRTAGVDAHVHVDPTAHDERTVAQFRQLFDAVQRSGHGGADRGVSAAGERSGEARAMATDGGERDRAGGERNQAGGERDRDGDAE